MIDMSECCRRSDHDRDVIFFTHFLLLRIVEREFFGLGHQLEHPER